MTTDEKINLIQNKLLMLKALDKNLDIFGASSHKYCLNEKLRVDEVEAFERRYSITLPDEYRAFVENIGNGGAGPCYGVQTLEDSLFSDLNYKRPGEFVDPSMPFPFTEPWNMEFAGDDEDDAAYEKHEKEYFSKKWETGVLRICNYGCGTYINLVVNGYEKGNIWVDDRGNDGGVYPDSYIGRLGRITFLDWYNLWLDKSLGVLKTQVPCAKLF